MSNPAESAQRHRTKAFARLKRLRRTRFYIEFNLKLNGERSRGVWPRLFLSLPEAEAAIQAFPVFLNSAATPTRGRLVSCCINRTLLKESA